MFLKRQLKLILSVFAAFLLSAQLLFANSGSLFDIHDILWTFVNNVFGWLFGAAGAMLTYTLDEFVIGFGNIFINDGVGAAVDIAWVIVRDIFNLTFIFGLIWIGFKMILRSDDSNTRKWLVNLIMAALLVNFSLFITKFIVDFTNLLATQLLLNGFPTVSGSAGSGVINLFMTEMGATTVWDGTWINKSEMGENFMAIFGAAMVFLIGAFVFFAGAIMLAIRFASLCLYMIFSPLMFLGWVFPQMQNVTSRYWRGFLGRAFYAPAYVVLIYFAAAVMTSFGGSVKVGSPTFANAFAGGSAGFASSGMSTLVPFLMVCIFLIAAIVVGQKLSADGASTTMRVMNNVQNRAQRFATNSAYGAARFSGRAATAAPRAAGGAAGRRASYALGSGLERQINRMQQSNSKVVSGLARINAVDNAARSRAGKMKNAKFGLDRTIEEERLYKNKTNDRGNRQRDFENAKNAAFKDDSKTPEEKKQAEAKMAALMAKMSDDEIKALPNSSLKDEGWFKSMLIEGWGAAGEEYMEEKKTARERLVANMSDGQIKALQDSGQYTNEEIKTIKASRNDAILGPLEKTLENSAASTEDLTTTIEELGRAVRGMNTDRLGALGIDRLSDERIAANLTEKQIDGLRDSGNYTPQQIADIQAARKTGTVQLVETGTLYSTKKKDSDGKLVAMSQDEIDTKKAGLQKDDSSQKQTERLFKQSAQDAGKLPVEVYAQPGAQQYITPQALQQRVRNGGMSETDRQAIEDNINAYLATADERNKNMWQKWAKDTTEGSNFNFGQAAAPAGPRPVVLGPDGRPMNQ